MGKMRPVSLRLMPVTQMLLSLRRMAESEAQARLRAARSALEVARIMEHQAGQHRQQLAQQLDQLRRRAEHTVGAIATAQALAEQARSFGYVLRALTQAQAEETARTAQCSELRHEIDELQQHLRWCVARREAAELRESSEKRELRRQRDRRERAIEEDARDRILSSSRPGSRR